MHRLQLFILFSVVLRRKEEEEEKKTMIINRLLFCRIVAADYFPHVDLFDLYLNSIFLFLFQLSDLVAPPPKRRHWKIKPNKDVTPKQFLGASLSPWRQKSQQRRFGTGRFHWCAAVVVDVHVVCGSCVCFVLCLPKQQHRRPLLGFMCVQTV
jgi:hypothetical protein